MDFKHAIVVVICRLEHLLNNFFKSLRGHVRSENPFEGFSFYFSLNGLHAVPDLIPCKCFVFVFVESSEQEFDLIIAVYQRKSLTSL
jgi:hypothetical protein